MAYRIKQAGSDFVVYSVGGDTVPGGLHSNRAAAVRHLRTLYSRLSNEQRRSARRFRGTILQSKDTGAGAMRNPVSRMDMPREGAIAPMNTSAGKQAQQDVNYRIGTPPITCATCKYFNALDNSCDKVAGYISPDATSDLYAAEDYGKVGQGNYADAKPNVTGIKAPGVVSESAVVQDVATTDEALPTGQMNKRSGKDRRSRPRPMMNERRKGDVLKRILSKPAPVRSNDTQGTPDTGVYSENHRAYPRDYLYMGRTFSPGQRKRYSANGIAMKDGCLSGETLVETLVGHRRIDRLVGSQVLLTDKGWVRAEVRSFGYADLFEVSLERSGERRSVFATLNHRWYLSDGRILTTAELGGGEDVPYIALQVIENSANTDLLNSSNIGITGKAQKPSDATREMVVVNLEGGPVTARGTLAAQAGCPTTESALSALSYNQRIKLGAGNTVLGFKHLTAAPEPALISNLDFVTTGLRADSHAETAVSTPVSTPLREVGMRPFGTASSTLERAFISDGSTACPQLSREQISSSISAPTKVVHYAEPSAFDGDGSVAIWCGTNFHTKSYPIADNWRIASITRTERHEEVFCAVVPELHRFTLAGGILTGNSYPIPDVDALRKAINASEREGNPPREHIKGRAAALGNSGLIPGAWVERDALIVQETFCPTLRFEASDAVGVTLLQEAPAPGGVARLKVPFIIGNSIAKAPGFSKKLFWPAELIDSIVNEGNKQIASATQPLTVYARHADAVDPTALPIGAVTEMSREGNVGYAVLDIINEGKGAQVIALASAKPRPLINAVSLRSGAGRFDLTEEKVNGEIMHVPTRVAIDGIDMAPNSPAMATYGVQMLAAEATVEHVNIPTLTRSTTMSDLTAEALRQEDPGLVAEIEAPMRARLNELEQENNSLKQENTVFKASVAKADRDAYIIELSSKFPEPEKALPVLQEHCKDASTKDDVRAATFDVMLELLSANRAAPAVPAADPKDALRKLFVVGGAGASITAEVQPEDAAKFAGKEGQDHIGDLALPSF